MIKSTVRVHEERGNQLSQSGMRSGKTNNIISIAGISCDGLEIALPAWEPDELA